MSKDKDPVDILVKRVAATLKLEILFKKNGDIINVLAHRYLFVRQVGVDVVNPQPIGVIQLPPSQLTTAMINKIVDINTLVDSLDNSQVVVGLNAVKVLKQD